MENPPPEPRRVRPLRILAIVLAAGLTLWVWGELDQPSVPPSTLSGGFDLPSFELPLLNAELFEGDTTLVSATDLEGKVVLASFWATWCQPCIEEQPSLLELQDEFADDGLRVVGILHRDRPSGALSWLEENDRAAFRTVVGTETVAREARVGGLPHTLLVDRNGEVVEVFYGYWSGRDAYLRERVRELLAESAT